MDKESYKSKSSVVVNTLYNMGGHFFVTLFSVILVPLMIRFAGIESYGLWAIIALIDASLNIPTLMFEYTCEKFMPEFLVKDDRKQINRYLSTGILFNGLTFALLAPLALLLTAPLSGLLKIPAHLTEDALYLFRGAVIVYCFRGAFVMLKGLQRGVQRMDIENRIMVIFYILRGIGFIAALSMGGGIRSMIWVEGAAVALNVAINWIMAHRLLTGLKISPLLFDFKTLGIITDFGLKLITCNIAGVALFQTDKLFISHYIGIALVAVYQVGFNLASVLQNKLQAVTAAICPFSAALHGDNEKEKLINLYRRGSKYNNLIQFPLWVLLYVLAERVIYAWLGPGFEESAAITRILIPALAFSIVNEVGIRTSIGMGHPELYNNYSSILIILNLPLTWFLVQKTGIRGAATASSITYIAASAYFILEYHRKFSISYDREFFKDIFSPLSLALLLGIPLHMASAALGTYVSRIGIFSYIVLFCGVYLALYALIVLKTGLLDAIDRNFLKNNLFKGKLSFLGRLL